MTAPRPLVLLRPKTLVFWLVAVAALLVAAWGAGAARADAYDPPAPWVASDKQDYAPGEQVTLAGGNWSPGETVHIRINDDAGQTWSRDANVTAAADGTIADGFTLPDWFVATYTITATGSSGSRAYSSFTDGNVVVRARSGAGSPLAATFQAGAVRRFNNTACTAPSAASNTNPVTTSGSNNNYTNSTVAANNAQSASLTAPASITSGGTTYTFSGWEADSPAELVVSTTGTTGCFHRATPNQGNDPAWNVTANYVAVPTNTAPTVAVDNATATVNEGQTATNTGTWSDSNAADSVTLSASIGTVTKAGTNASGTWSWSFATTDGTDQSQTVTITANDGNGGTRQTTFSLVVSNVAPTVTLAAGNDVSVSEGATQHTYAYAISDPGADTVASVSTSCGANGTKVPGSDTNTNSGGSFACTFDDGPRTSNITASATDSDGATGPTATQPATIANIAPTATFPTTRTITEGAAETFAFTSPSDPSGGDTTAGFHYAYSCTGASLAGATYAGSSTSPTVDCPASAFADGPGSQTIRARIIDRDGGFTEYTTAATIENATPSVSAATDQESEEGEARSFDLGSFSDPGASDDPWAVDVDWGDGSADTTFDAAAQGSLGSRSHTYADDGTYAVTVTVTDKDGGLDTAAFEATVANIAPKVSLTGPNQADEGDTKTYEFAITDPGASDAFHFVSGFPTCGLDGQLVDPDTGASIGPGAVDIAERTFSCLFPDGNTSTNVAVRVADDDGAASAADTEHVEVIPVAVANVAPTVTAAADQPATEGTSTSFSIGSFSDPGTDSPWDVDVDWGDGSAHTTFQATASGAASAQSLGSRSHSYDDDGTYTVTVTVTDKNGAAATNSFHVTAANTAPTAALSNSGPVEEGSAATVSFSAQSDASSADGAAGFHYAYACDGGSLDAATYAAGGSSASQACTFADDGTYTVRARIIDKDGGYSEYTTDVTVTNVRPTVTAPADDGGVEGTSKSFGLGSFGDPGANDGPWHVHVAWGDGSPASEFDASSRGALGMANHAYADDGTYSMTVTVTDKDGASDSQASAITVANADPVVTAAADQSATEASSTSFALGSFSDAGAGDAPWAATVDWGDGSDLEHLADTFSQGPLGSASHTYDDSGAYTVKVTVSDKDGGSGFATFTAHASNVAPEADLGNSGPIDEGGSATVSFTNPSDPSSADTAAGFHYAFACDGGSLAGATYGTSGTSASRQCTFDDDTGGPFTVRARIIDKDGGFSERTTSVAVHNVAPHITSFSGTGYFRGPNSFLGSTASASTFSGAWTDPGGDTWTALVTWPDGSPLSQTLGGLTTRSFPAPQVGHTFASAGCKTSSLRVTDDDGASDTATTVVNVGTGVFQPPMTNQSVTDKLKNGQVLPVKVRFTDCSGAPLANLTPAIRLATGDLTPLSDDGSAPITVPTSVSGADTTGVMRSNGDGSYIYNMSVNVTLNKDYTILVYPYGTAQPQKLGHVIQATK